MHLPPYLLLAHLDVVPAGDATKWDFPPFSAEIHDGFLYGRGTVDDKHNVFVCNLSVSLFCLCQVTNLAITDSTCSLNC